MSEAPELLPCPFCGGEDIAAELMTENDGDTLAFVGCGRCGGNMSTEVLWFNDGSEDLSRAATDWNTRADLLDAAHARIAELSRIIEQADYLLGGETAPVKKRFADWRRNARAALAGKDTA